MYVAFVVESNIKLRKVRFQFYENPKLNTRQRFLELLHRHIIFLGDENAALPPPANLFVAPPMDRDQSLFPEYIGLGLPALIAILRDRVPEPERHALDNVLRGLKITAQREDEEQQVLRMRNLILPRWRQAWTSFFNCTKQDPFCVNESQLQIHDDIASIDVGIGGKFYCITFTTTTQQCYPLYDHLPRP